MRGVLHPLCRLLACAITMSCASPWVTDLYMHARDELLAMYRHFCKDYPIISIEDPFDQDDWDSTTKLTTEGLCQVPCTRPAGSGMSCHIKLASTA